jgi:predicted transcriptional regulator
MSTDVLHVRILNELHKKYPDFVEFSIIAKALNKESKEIEIQLDVLESRGLVKTLKTGGGMGNGSACLLPRGLDFIQTIENELAKKPTKPEKPWGLIP